MLSPELIQYFKGGLSMMVATRTRELRVEAARGFGIVINESGDTASVYIREANQDKVLKNLRENGEIAVVTARPTTYESYQLKGKYLGHRQTDDRDIPLVEGYKQRFNKEINDFGSPGFLGKSNPWPLICIDFRIVDVFNQTPGEKAGERLIL